MTDTPSVSGQVPKTINQREGSMNASFEKARTAARALFAAISHKITRQRKQNFCKLCKRYEKRNAEKLYTAGTFRYTPNASEQGFQAAGALK